MLVGFEIFDEVDGCVCEGEDRGDEAEDEYEVPRHGPCYEGGDHGDQKAEGADKPKDCIGEMKFHMKVLSSFYVKCCAFWLCS